MMETARSNWKMSWTVIMVFCFAPEIAPAMESFTDDFSNPDASNPDRNPATWRAVFGGSIAIADGDLVVGKSSGLAGALVDAFAAKDLAVETQFRIMQGTDAGIGIRTIGANVSDCYFGNLDVADGAGLFRCGATALGASVPVNVDPTNEDVAMRLEVVGDQLSLWVWPADETRPAEPLAVAHDSALAEGGVGVYINPDFGGPTEAVFRFVNVEVLNTIPGDYNSDGTVDAADYVVWRKGLGTTYTATDYDVWRKHFGPKMSEGLSASGAAGSPLDTTAQSMSTNIPEPTVYVLLLTAATLSFSRRSFHGRRRRRSLWTKKCRTEI
jgi:hypothetical protein